MAEAVEVEEDLLKIHLEAAEEVAAVEEEVVDLLQIQNLSSLEVVAEAVGEAEVEEVVEQENYPPPLQVESRMQTRAIAGSSPQVMSAFLLVQASYVAVQQTNQARKVLRLLRTCHR